MRTWLQIKALEFINACWWKPGIVGLSARILDWAWCGAPLRIHRFSHSAKERNDEQEADQEAAGGAARNLTVTLQLAIPDNVSDWDVHNNLIENIENQGWEWYAIVAKREDDEQEADQEAD